MILADTPPTAAEAEEVAEQQLALLRHTQLDLARQGRVLESAEIADRAQRMLDHLTQPR